MDGIDNRRHARLRHRAKISVTGQLTPSTIIADMKDFSESGLFLLHAGDPMPRVGALVKVQTTEFEGAPVQSARVIRIEEGVGFGVEFILEN